MNRIFFDFSLISKHTKVTGIPRVIYEYFNRFMEISLLRRGDWIVHPVYPEGIGTLKDCVHNLPRNVIIRYCEYLDKVADLAPFYHGRDMTFMVADLNALLKKQINGRLETVPPARNNDVPLKRRIARFERDMILKIANRDPRLKKLIEENASGRPFREEEIPRELPQCEGVSLRDGEIFHKPDEGDILFMPAYWHDVNPVAYFTLQQSGVKIIPMLHDLLPVIIPDKYEKVWSRYFHFNVHATCLLSDAVVSISHATRNDLERLMESHSHQPPEIFVQHHGFDFGQATQKKLATSKRFPSDGSFFIMVGSIEPKKNHTLVIDQFISFAKTNPHVRLKIIGFPGWMHEPITSKIHNIIGDGHPVDYYNDVDDAELALAYSNALATIVASSHEGFGLPVIESLSLGCPVILSDIPVFREIAGSSGLYFSLEDPETIIEAMSQRVSTSAPRRIEGFHWPTWDEQASRLFDFIVTRASPKRTVYGEMARDPLSGTHSESAGKGNLT